MSYDNNKNTKTNKNYNKNNQRGNDFRNNDRDSIYEPKHYAKKEKPKNELYDFQIPDYIMIKEEGRLKRENDRKHRNRKYR